MKLSTEFKLYFNQERKYECTWHVSMYVLMYMQVYVGTRYMYVHVSMEARNQC